MRGSAVFRTGVTPGGALAGPWVRDPLWTRARAVPSLDLRFADNKSLVDATTGSNLVTFTRASSGTFVGSDGVLRTATNDAPRFDHNPTTGESLGLLVEEARTNSIRNNTMVGAVAGTPGTLPTNWANNAAAGVTFSVIATGTENGITYIDLKAVAASAPSEISFRFESNTQATAASGQPWTASTYLKVQAGSLANITAIAQRVREFNSGGTQVQVTTQDVAADGTLRRFATTRTLSDATTTTVNSLLAISCTVGAAIDITLRIGLPQLEQGAFATSVIPTTTAAATRSADVASITGTAFSSWYRQDEGTVFAEVDRNTAITATTTVVSINDNTINNRLFNFRQDSASQLTVISQTGGSLDASPQVSLINTSARNKVAAAQALNNLAASANGGTAVADLSVAMPTINQMQIGNVTNVSLYNGTIRRLSFWPQRLSNTTLQTLTQ